MTDSDQFDGPTGEEAPRFTDRRRLDPETGEVRGPQSAAPAPGDAGEQPDAAPAGSAAGAEAPADPRVDQLQTALTERTADLQRLQAEYVNYKRRVDRDRDLTRQLGAEAVLRDLLGVLDNVDAARQHEELTGGVKLVAEEIEKVAARHGLERFGTEGDPFDPRIHEALMHAHAEGITGPTCVEVLQAGYRVKEKILRPARVAVAEPSEPASTPTEPSA